jgi:hypothetical protein
MIILPKEKPVVQNLNSYYLDINKLLEHFQGELGSGGIHFSSTVAEGVIFFDKDDFLNGIYEDKDVNLKGKEAIHAMIEGVKNYNFAISIYEIHPERIYFWANIPKAEIIYEGLSTEFTDLEGLIRKMSAEKLTGYIDVTIGNGEEGGLIFLNNGQIIGGSFSWSKGELNRTEEGMQPLIKKTKDSGGVFNVMKIPQEMKKEKNEVKATTETKPKKIEAKPLTMIQELLIILERIINNTKNIKTDFNTLLKKKFIEKAEKYSFLDPFANEFTYIEQKVSFTGDASDEALFSGIIESVREMADVQGILSKVRTELGPWSQKYAGVLAKWGVSF